MDNPTNKLIINRMTTRRSRRSRALEPNYVALDERSLLDLLCFAPTMARLIRYYGPDNQDDGSFEAFFLADPVMILATLVALPFDAIEKELVGLERDAREGALSSQKREIPHFRRFVQLAVELQKHLGSEHSTNVPERVHAAIAAELQNLQREMRPFMDHLDGSGVFCGKIHVGTLLHAIEGIQTASRRYWGAFLETRGHKPHLALYFAFAQLLQKAQGSLNAISNRYFDFYYRDILRETPRGAVGDNVHLTFTAAQGTASTVVPVGTRFSAGKDAHGADIVFSSSRTLSISTARLVSQRMMHVEVEPFFQDPVPQRVFVKDNQQTTVATLGLAIASPYLALSGGERTLCICFRCPVESIKTLCTRLERVASAVGMGIPDVLQKVLARAFRLSLSSSGPNPWFDVEYTVRVATNLLDDPQFELEIVLPHDAPPVAPNWDTRGPAPDAPTLKMVLNQHPISWSKGGVSTYPLSVLAELEVETIWLETEVSGLSDVILQNTGGVLDTSKPFFIFGGAPSLGAYLDIHHYEVFAKRIHHLGVTIDWFGLPACARGFAGYYEDYHIGVDGIDKAVLFDNQSFKASFRVLNPGTSSLGEDPSSVHLFRTTVSEEPNVPEPVEELAASSHFDVSTAVTSARPTHYDPLQRALRLRLVAPREAFGDVVYPQNVLAAAMPELHKVESDNQDEVEQGEEQDAAIPEPREVESDNQDEAGQGEEQDAAISEPREVESDNQDEAGQGEEQDAAISEPQEVESDNQDEVEQGEEQDAAISEPQKVEPEPPKRRMPNVPWTPRAERIALNYTTKCVIVGETPPDTENVEQSGTAFHLLPLDGFRAWSNEGNHELLAPADDRSDNLLLGITRLSPGELLTLLVHQATVAEITAESRPTIAWEYLVGNQWTPMVVRHDETRNLRRTGTIVLQIPSKKGENGTVLPSDHSWIRARATGGSTIFSRIVGIYPHAVLCSWQKNESTGEHLAQPRPAGSIKSSLDKLAHIATIEQPMASFGGIPPETAKTMPIRLGERIRHKERAILGWDFERLVLERFPQIEQVRAFRGKTPGQVHVVVIPGPHEHEGIDPTAPVADFDTLGAIQESLAEAQSPFAEVRVVNPNYVRITVKANVEFVPNADPTTCRARLNDELVQALSPWSTDVPWADFDNGIPTTDDVAEFIRKRPYVNAVMDVSFELSPDPETFDWYFLTTATKHEIYDAGVYSHG